MSHTAIVIIVQIDLRSYNLAKPLISRGAS